MKAIDRLYDYFNVKSIKPTAFEKLSGLSNGYLGTQKRREADIGESIIMKIINYCPDLSIEWLLTGEGDMLRDSSEKIEEPSKEDRLLAIIESQQRTIEELSKKV